MLDAHSVSAGLDYPGVGPEHCLPKDTGRAEYVAVTDEEALEAFQLLSRTEGIIPALESRPRASPTRCGWRRDGRGAALVVNLSAGATRTWTRWPRILEVRAMSRIAERFAGDAAAARRRDRACSIYVTAGYPDLETPGGCIPELDAAARTWSSWACRSPTRWRTVRQSRRASPNGRWRPGPTLADVLELAATLRDDGRADCRSC